MRNPLIVLYDTNEENFSTLGLGVLRPTECIIKESAGNSYELELTQPVLERGLHREIKPGRIIKAPSPTRESPDIYPPEVEETRRTYEIWKSVYSGRLHYRSKPNGTILGSITKDTEILKMEVDTSLGDTWFKMCLLNDPSVVGYIYPGYQGSPAEFNKDTEYKVGNYCRYQGHIYRCKKATTKGQSFQVDEWDLADPYLTNTGRHKTITSGGETNPTEEGMKFELAKYQLFRIYAVETVSEERVVKAYAYHISYDLAGVAIVAGGQGIDVSLNTLYTYFNQVASSNTYRVSHNAGFTFKDYTGLNYKGKWLTTDSNSVLDILMDDEEGVLGQTEARLVRDNFNIYTLPKTSRNLGFELRYGKNLLTCSVKHDISETITRIYPYGKLSNGDWFSAEPVDSSKISQYGIVAKVVRYNYTAAGTTATSSDKAAIRSMATQHFREEELDKPKTTIDSSFVRQELSPSFTKFANMYSMHLYDKIKVVDTELGVSDTFIFVSYEFDALKMAYTSVVLGTIEDIGTRKKEYSGVVGGNS